MRKIIDYKIISAPASFDFERTVKSYLPRWQPFGNLVHVGVDNELDGNWYQPMVVYED